MLKSSECTLNFESSLYGIFVCYGTCSCQPANGFIALMELLTKGISELHVLYADDLCTIIDDNMDANSVINSIKVKGERFGLIINEDKIETLELSYEAWK